MSMKHKGTCYRNSTLQPSSAEEHQSIEVARSLLIDSNGNYIGDEMAIFCNFISADNVTRATHAFI